MNENSSAQLQHRTRWAKDKLSLATAWLVPVFVWLLVITIGLAIAGLLLSEE